MRDEGELSPGPEETPEARLKRLRLRSWRRGTREMDLILGPYADAALAGMEPEALDAYEALLNEADVDLYFWVSGGAALPEEHSATLGEIRAHHGIA